MLHGTHNTCAQAGFEAPLSEVKKAIKDKSLGATTAKELLASIKPLASPEFHTALTEALAALEAETNSTVTLDAASAGYKKFADKVKVRPPRHATPSKQGHADGAVQQQASHIHVALAVCVHRRWRRRTSCPSRCWWRHPAQRCAPSQGGWQAAP